MKTLLLSLALVGGSTLLAQAQNVSPLDFYVDRTIQYTEPERDEDGNITGNSYAEQRAKYSKEVEQMSIDHAAEAQSSYTAQNTQMQATASAENQKTQQAINQANQNQQAVRAQAGTPANLDTLNRPISVDLNGDGSLSEAEVKARLRKTVSITKLDADSDGNVDWAGEKQAEADYRTRKANNDSAASQYQAQATQQKQQAKQTQQQINQHNSSEKQ